MCWLLIYSKGGWNPGVSGLKGFCKVYLRVFDGSLHVDLYVWIVGFFVVQGFEVRVLPAGCRGWGIGKPFTPPDVWEF